MSHIHVSHLSLNLADKYLLSNISFSLSQGQSLLIIGKSGSGKTLLTKTLLGNYPKKAVISGHIYYQKQDLLQLNNHQWQSLRGKHIAYLVQQPMAMYNPFQTIQTHVLETLKSHTTWHKDVCLKQMLDKMRQLSLDEPEAILKKYPFELSGGMLQRIMIAMLLCLEADTFVLDEPTSALDTANRERLIHVLKTLQAKGKTLITVTHDYHLARALGGEVMVLEDGKVIEKKRLETILKQDEMTLAKRLLVSSLHQRLVL